jgi:hypothetical protein
LNCFLYLWTSWLNWVFLKLTALLICYIVNVLTSTFTCNLAHKVTRCKIMVSNSGKNRYTLKSNVDEIQIMFLFAHWSKALNNRYVHFTEPTLYRRTATLCMFFFQKIMFWQLCLFLYKTPLMLRICTQYILSYIFFHYSYWFIRETLNRPKRR